MSKQRLVEALYEASQTTDESGLSKFDEQKLRRALDNNNKLYARNRDTFAAYEPKFHTCPMYDPCPICDKCRNKASHLYVRCQTCEIPMCAHTYQNRKNMIRRKNFKLNVNKNTINELRKLKEKVINNE